MKDTPNGRPCGVKPAGTTICGMRATEPGATNVRPFHCWASLYGMSALLRGMISTSTPAASM